MSASSPTSEKKINGFVRFTKMGPCRSKGNSSAISSYGAATECGEQAGKFTCCALGNGT